MHTQWQISVFACVCPCVYAETPGLPAGTAPTQPQSKGDSELLLSVLRGFFLSCCWYCGFLMQFSRGSGLLFLPLILLPPLYLDLWNEVPQSWPLLQRAWHPSCPCSAKLWNKPPSPNVIVLCPHDSWVVFFSFLFLPLNLSCVHVEEPSCSALSVGSQHALCLPAVDGKKVFIICQSVDAAQPSTEHL